MLSMTAAGLYLGAAIDTYKRFSKKSHSFHWLVALNDLLFWFIQALIVFYVLLQSNYGEVRFYIFLALLCGYAAYQALFQSVYKKLLETVITLCIKTYQLIRKLFFALIISPIKFILKVLYSLCMMIVSTVLAVFLFILKLIWKPIKGLTILLLKWTGLLEKAKKVQSIFARWKEFFLSIWKKKE